MLKRLWMAALLTTAAALSMNAIAKDKDKDKEKDKGKVAVALAAPADGAGYTAPAIVALSAEAQSSQLNHPVVQVQFFQGATLLGTATQAPYTLNWSNVAAGNYVLTATAINDKGDSAVSAPVSIHVNAPPTVGITTPATGAGFTGPASVAIAAAAADSDGSVARVEFYNGTTLLGTATAAPYVFNWNNVAPGNYAITARATDNQGAVTTSAAVGIHVNAVPTVSLTAPAGNASYTAPAGILLAANAADSDGSIARVEFYQGATLLGTAMSAPYTHAWNNVAAGNYTITARAIDNQGAAATSAAIAVNVNAPPSVSLSAPANNSVVTAPASIALTATAADSDGTIAKVEFFNGATLLGTATAAPYSFAWTDVAAGNYTVTAKATDNQGATTVSPAISVVVNQLPAVALALPVENQRFTAPASLILEAGASDADGAIAQVAFYQGNTLLATLTEGPYLYHWTGVAAGNYALTAKATDNRGGETTSAPVNVTVAANQLPTVTMTASPANATAPATIKLEAAAADADGTVAKVEFFSGETLLGTVSSEPYRFDWSGVPAGAYRVSAKATDNLGGVTQSAAVTVKVSANVTQAYYIYADHLDTPRVITDAANNVVWQWDNSDPFGNNLPVSNGFEFNLRFPGQYFDRETNLHYNYFRDYDPAIGRYIESDPIGLKGGINTYTYVLNNPIQHTDQLGLDLDKFPYFPSRSEHKNRNANNHCPRKKPELDHQCSKWTQDSGVLGRMNGGKFRSQSGDECAYDANGNLLPDANGNYTYNYAPNSWTGQHIWQDVIPHYYYGGSGSYTPGLTK